MADEVDPSTETDLSGVVAEQLPGVVAEQLPGALADERHALVQATVSEEVSAERFNENKGRLDQYDLDSTAATATREAAADTLAVVATQVAGRLDQYDLDSTAAEDVRVQAADVLAVVATHVADQLAGQRKVAENQQDTLVIQHDAIVRERSRTNRRLLVGFVLVVLVFALLAVRTQVAISSIKDTAHTIAVNSWNSCNNSIASRTSINATNKAFADVLAAVKPQTPAVLKLLAVYQAGILPIPECGPKP